MAADRAPRPPRGEKRFNEFKRSTDASSRTFSRVLEDLRELGFVERRVEVESPIATYTAGQML